MRGRPKKKVTRSNSCRIPMTPDEARMLTAAKEKTGLPKTEIIREALSAYYKTISLERGTVYAD